MPSLIYDITHRLSQGIVKTDPRFIAVPDHFVNLIPTVPGLASAWPCCQYVVLP